MPVTWGLLLAVAVYMLHCMHCAHTASQHCPLQNTDIKELLWMFWILIVLLVVTRAVFVAPVSLLHNRFAQHKLQYKEMIVIWWVAWEHAASWGQRWAGWLGSILPVGDKGSCYVKVAIGGSRAL